MIGLNPGETGDRGSDSVSMVRLSSVRVSTFENLIEQTLAGGGAGPRPVWRKTLIRKIYNFDWFLVYTRAGAGPCVSDTGTDGVTASSSEHS